jgi:hypothetical protein
MVFSEKCQVPMARVAKDTRIVPTAHGTRRIEPAEIKTPQYAGFSFAEIDAYFV